VTNPEGYTLDFMIMKVDFDGNLLWYKSQEYELGGWEVAPAFDLTSDGGYFLSGMYSENEVLFDDDDAFCMMKMNSHGDKEWHQIHDGPLQDTSPTRGCGQTNDGGYVMCGMTESFGANKWDIWLLKTDSDGNKLWDKIFGGGGYENCWGMQVTSDGGYILAIGYNLGSAMDTMDDIWVIKTDSDGNVIWSYLIDEEERQIPIFIDETEDKGFIIGGRTGDPDDEDCDSFLLKLAPLENERPLKPTISGRNEGKTNKTYTFTASSSDPDGNRIYYMWDWGDGVQSEWLDTSKASHSWSTEGEFEIRVLVKDAHGGESDWSDPFAFSAPRVRAATLNFLMIKILERFPLLQNLLGH
jgi:hypothetical protein